MATYTLVHAWYLWTDGKNANIIFKMKSKSSHHRTENRYKVSCIKFKSWPETRMASACRLSLVVKVVPVFVQLQVELSRSRNFNGIGTRCVIHHLVAILIPRWRTRVYVSYDFLLQWWRYRPRLNLIGAHLANKLKLAIVVITPRKY